MFKRVFILASTCCLWTQVQAAELTSYSDIEDSVRAAKLHCQFGTAFKVYGHEKK